MTLGPNPAPHGPHLVMLIHLYCLWLFSCYTIPVEVSSYDRDSMSCKAKNMFYLGVCVCVYIIIIT